MIDPETFTIRSEPCPSCDGRIVYNTDGPTPAKCSDCKDNSSSQVGVTDWA